MARSWELCQLAKRSVNWQFCIIADERLQLKVRDCVASENCCAKFTHSLAAIKPNSRVWVLDRRAFQQIMMRTGLQRIEENVTFLKSVPLLKNLSEEVLCKIADVLELVIYAIR
jgi:hypothetical protein